MTHQADDDGTGCAHTGAWNCPHGYCWACGPDCPTCMPDAGEES